jgi:hypothetical protein
VAVCDPCTRPFADAPRAEAPSEREPLTVEAALRYLRDPCDHKRASCQEVGCEAPIQGRIADLLESLAAPGALPVPEGAPRIEVRRGDTGWFYYAVDARGIVHGCYPDPASAGSHVARLRAARAVPEGAPPCADPYHDEHMPPGTAWLCPSCNGGWKNTRLRLAARGAPEHHDLCAKRVRTGEWTCHPDCTLAARGAPEGEERLPSVDEVRGILKDAPTVRSTDEIYRDSAPEGDDLRERLLEVAPTVEYMQAFKPHPDEAEHWRRHDISKEAPALMRAAADRITSLTAERDDALQLAQFLATKREAAEAERDAAVESLNMLMRDPAEARAERLAAALREIADATAHAMANAPAPRASWYAEYRRWAAPYISSIDETSRRALAGEKGTEHVD